MRFRNVPDYELWISERHGPGSGHGSDQHGRCLLDLPNLSGFGLTLEGLKAEGLGGLDSWTTRSPGMGTGACGGLAPELPEFRKRPS